MIKTNLHIIFLFLFCVISLAQEPIRYSTKQGLPSNHIYDIQEDADGFMWFATNRGLVKFDGETFRTFTIKDGLPNNDTWLLDLDYQGKLWYFSKSNYQGYIKNDSIYKFPIGNDEVVSPAYIAKSKNNFWFYGGGIKTLKKKSFKNTSIYKDRSFIETQKKYSKVLQKLNLKSQKPFYFTNPQTNTTVFVGVNKQFYFDENFNLLKETDQKLSVKLERKKVSSFGMLYNQIVYFGFDEGLLFVDFKNKTVKYINLKKLTNSDVYAFMKIKGLKSEIQVSFFNHLLIFDYNLELKEKYNFKNSQNNKGCYKDSKGNIWLRSFENGLYFLSKSQLNSKYYLKNKKVQKINTVGDHLFVGINNDGFYNLNLQDNKFKRFIKFDDTDGEVYGIKNDSLRHETLFISAANSYGYKNSILKPFEINYEDILLIYKQNKFKDITFFNKDNYFTVSSGIIRYNYKTKLGKLIKSNGGLSKSIIFQNQLFFGGSDGLHLLKNTLIFNQKKKNTAFLRFPIRTFLATKENLFVGTDGRGVYIYNEDKINHLKNTDGYSVQKIIKKGNTLWMATQNGVHEVILDVNNLSNSKITNSFYESDGLLQNNTNDIFIEKDTLYSATDIGLTKLTINNHIYKQKPSLYFKTKNDTLIFKEDKRDNIAVTFALQDYTNQDYVNYKYRLLPAQKKWINTTTKTLNFSNLSPNLYTLEVKATDQHFNTKVKKQVLKVIHFWYETKLALIVFVVLFVLILFFVFYITKKRIEQKATEKAAQEKRISGLELQALRSQMNPHFVHNSLNAIQYFIQRNEVENSENYLSKFSLLIRLFFEYSRRQTLSLNEEIQLLDNYLEIEKLRFEDKLNYQIIVDEELEIDEVNIPSMILQPIVENAVNHGLFHKKDNGRITIHFKAIDLETYRVVVFDNGVGIKKSKEIYKRSSKNYRSNSTEVLKERLSLLQKSQTWEIEYSIEDLSEQKGKEGTKVSITFKQILL